MFGREKNLNQSPAMADFEAQSNNGVTYKFVNTSWYEPTEFEWDFGTGDKSIKGSPIYTFLKDGVYNITLKATNKYGSGTIKTMQIKIVGSGERLFKDNGEQFGFTQDILQGYGNYGSALGVENI